MKKALRISLAAVLALLLVVASYVVYVLVDYHRLPDMLEGEISGSGAGKAEAGEEYTLLSYNIGFAAYTPDFGFFMDGGDESRAFSAESVYETMGGITKLLKDAEDDFIMLEEVDVHATRSHHIDQAKILTDALEGYDSTFAVNYDSPYLFYPIFEPHGKSYAGMLTLSKFDMTSSLRRSLPIEQSLMKLLDLDRCYSVTRIDTDNGKELVLYTAHLSAYTSDGKIAEEQLKMLIADMQGEYEKGNYVICGGDFNKDLLGNSDEVFGNTPGEFTWAQPVPQEMYDGTALTQVAPTGAPSCRNADGPYHEGQYVVTVDGFIVSDNVKVARAEVVDTGFEYSDHNPVRLTFTLEK